MPRNISMFHTQQQVASCAKWVTRRMGWQHLRPGTQLQPVVKSMGLKKGECIERIGGLIEVVDCRREPLNCITTLDVVLEGFPDWTPAQFVEFFCESMNCAPDQPVTRIEFRYL